MMSTHIKEEPPDTYQQSDHSDGQDDDEDDGEDVIIVDTETTIRYIRGKLSCFII